MGLESNATETKLARARRRSIFLCQVNLLAMVKKNPAITLALGCYVCREMARGTLLRAEPNARRHTRSSIRQFESMMIILTCSTSQFVTRIRFSSLLERVFLLERVSFEEGDYTADLQHFLRVLGCGRLRFKWSHHL